jgi:formamidopyrimidine-DNA glycosylase
MTPPGSVYNAETPMPELPELEIVREVLLRRLRGRRVEEVRLSGKGAPIVVRDLTGLGFMEGVRGQSLEDVSRRGKFLLFQLAPSALFLAVNPKLTGRLQLCPPGEKKAGPVHVIFEFSDPSEELRYVDSKTMGQIYLTGSLAAVPTFEEMGPDALAIDLEEFRRRLRSFRGEIKGILTRAPFVTGIGNAYADEILWEAQLHPFRKRTSLSADEVERLHASVHSTLAAAVDQVRREMGDDIHLKPRDFFAVHMRGGAACPRCGTAISEITANQRITSFCRTCQPGGLIRGMGSARGR